MDVGVPRRMARVLFVRTHARRPAPSEPSHLLGHVQVLPLVSRLDAGRRASDGDRFLPHEGPPVAPARTASGRTMAVLQTTRARAEPGNGRIREACSADERALALDTDPSRGVCVSRRSPGLALACGPGARNQDRLEPAPCPPR